MKVVIAIPDIVNLEKLKSALERKKYEVVGSTINGAEALNMVQEYSPDVLVVNMFLPIMDGVTLSCEAKKQPNVTVVMLSPVGRDDIVTDAFNRGRIDYYIIPNQYGDELAGCIHRAINILKKPVRAPLAFASIDEYKKGSHSMEKLVTDLMIRLGLKTSLKGYGYIRRAIIMALEDVTILNSITKGLYPALAEEAGSTSQRVERAIRHSVEVLFDTKSNREFLDEIFGYTINSEKGKPSNSEFLFLLVDRIRQDNNLV